MSQPGITKRDWKIIEYIKKNAGCSKQDVVRGMNGDPSRITILNILNKLENERMIIARKERTNSQIYRLFVNNESLIITKKQLLDDFKNSYLKLLEKSKEKMRSKEDNKMLKGSLLLLYEHFVGMCLFAVLFTWPEKIGDKQDLNKLSTLAFTNLQEVQLKLSEVISKGDKTLVNSMASYVFKLYPEIFPYVVNYLREYGLDNESEKAIDSIWNITFDFLSEENVNEVIGKSCAIKDPRNWREIFEEYERQRQIDLRDFIRRKPRSLPSP
ncbi:MAG: BlaI/MecI/CopY family transcriptional regulator [Nitrososphaeraceae archaeon]